MHGIFLSKEAVRFLVNLDKTNEEMIRSKLKKLAESPEFFGKHLKGTNSWSLRIGKYRVLFEIDKEENKILIMTIGHRKEVYRKIREDRVSEPALLDSAVLV